LHLLTWLPVPKRFRLSFESRHLQIEGGDVFGELIRHKL
jgi:hypothetical protein